ncbi:MAG: YtxH domain-containing protein [Elusimicrobiota bacterium]
MNTEETKGTPAWAYLLGGVALGATLGILFAPKKGSELREDIADWTKRRAEEGKAFVARMRKEAPIAVAAAKARTQEAIEAVKERTNLVKS